VPIEQDLNKPNTKQLKPSYTFSMASNKEVVLTEYVGKGNQPEPKHFLVKEAAENPALNDGEVLAQTLYLSVDPYMRGRMNPDRSYVAPFTVGQALNGSGCGRVIESKHPNYQPGDKIASLNELNWPWREYVVLSKSQVDNCKKISEIPDHLVSHTIGQLGMPGLTAYFGTLNRGAPKAGETFVVSGGAGACGSIAGQIAKLKGCRVIGIASTDKISYMTEELGFDHGIDYVGKSEDQLFSELQAVCPDGVDIYYDNVGGIISHAVLRLMNENGRVPICGQISQYNSSNPDPLPDSIVHHLTEKKVQREWFMVFSFKEHFDSALNDLLGWVNNGNIKVHQTIFEGIENLPNAFLGLFNSINKGKLVVKLAD